jgi:flagellar basal body-associated protein FliL
MKKLLLVLCLGIGAVSVVGAYVVIGAEPVAAANNCKGVNTAILGCGYANDGIGGILRLVIQILTGGVGVLATAGIIISAIQYSSAGDNTEQVAKAKKRIRDIVIGILAYATMATITNFLVPGGVF